MKLILSGKNYVIIHHRRRFSLGAIDPATAADIYTKIAVELALSELCSNSSPIISSPEDSSHTADTALGVADAFAEYLHSCQLRKMTKFTLNFKQNVCRKLLASGVESFADVDQKHINAFADLISDYAVDTQRKYITDLMAFLNNSAKKGYIDKETVARIDLPKYRSKPRELIIEDDDWHAILAAADKKDHNFYLYLLTLFHTFSRPNEVTELKGSDFHLAERYVDIFQHKTQKMKRVFLEADFAAEISALVAERKSDYLFDQHGKNPESYAKKFKYICQKLNLNSKYILYTVRHTAITYLMNKTNDVEFVARQAGNNPAITMKHYVNRRSQHFLDILDKNQ